MDNIKEVNSMLERHFEDDNRRFDELKERLDSIDDKLSNHLVHIAKDISFVQNDMSWVKRFFWLITGTSITAIVSALISLILK